MTQVVVDISMSLDGFVTGPNDRPGARCHRSPDVRGQRRLGRQVAVRGRIVESPYATHISYRVVP